MVAMFCLCYKSWVNPSGWSPNSGSCAAIGGLIGLNAVPYESQDPGESIDTGHLAVGHPLLTEWTFLAKPKST